MAIPRPEEKFVPSIQAPHKTAPADEYLATKPSVLLALAGSVVVLLPVPELTIVIPAVYCPVTSTLPAASEAIPNPASAPVLEIRAAHPSCTVGLTDPLFATTDPAETNLSTPNVPNIGNPLDP